MKKVLFALLGAIQFLNPTAKAQIVPPTSVYTRTFLRSVNQSNAWFNLGIVATNQTQVTNWITSIGAGTDGSGLLNVPGGQVTATVIPASMGTNVLTAVGTNVTIQDSYGSGVHTYTFNAKNQPGTLFSNSTFAVNITNAANKLGGDLSLGTGLPLSGLSTAGAANGQVVGFNGSAWVPTAGGGGGGGAATNWFTVQEYWVSPTNNSHNLGTYQDPFDGSTKAKFDAVMKMVTTTNTGNVYIHLMPGTFLTDGQYGGAASKWPLQSNTKIEGAGMGITTVKADGAAATANQTVIGTALDSSPTINGGLQDNDEVCNLTVDCDGQDNTTATAVHGVTLIGKNMRIHNVAVINGLGTSAAGGGASGKDWEGFAFTIAGMDYPPRPTNILAQANAVIENCVVSNTVGTYYNGFSMFELEGGRISGNRVMWKVITNSYAISSFHGVNIAGCVGMNIGNNYIHGGTEGIYSDGEQSAMLGLTNINVHDNTFDQTQVAAWNFQPYTNATVWDYKLKLHDNTINVSRWGNNSNFLMRAWQLYGKVTDAEIYGNNIVGPGPLGTNYWSGYMGGAGFVLDHGVPGSIRVHNNSWETNGGSFGVTSGIGIESTITNNFIFSDNYDENGFLNAHVNHTNYATAFVGTLLGQAVALSSGATVTNLIVNDNTGARSANFGQGPSARRLTDGSGIVSVDWGLRSLDIVTNGVNIVPVISWTNTLEFRTNINSTASTNYFSGSLTATHYGDGSHLTGLVVNGAGFTNIWLSGVSNVGVIYFGSGQPANIDNGGNATFPTVTATTLNVSTLTVTNPAVLKTIPTLAYWGTAFTNTLTLDGGVYYANVAPANFNSNICINAVTTNANNLAENWARLRICNTNASSAVVLYLTYTGQAAGGPTSGTSANTNGLTIAAGKTATVLIEATPGVATNWWNTVSQ